MRDMRAWAWLPILLILLTAGCGQTTPTDVLRVLIWPIPVPEGLFARGPSERAAEWDREPEADGEAQPGGPALALSLGRRQAVARLHQTHGERRIWRSAGGLVVATDGARVVATAGLAEGVAATRFDGPDPLATATMLRGGEAQTRRVVDLMRLGRQPHGMSFGIILECRLRVTEADAESMLIEERCRGDASFTNRFWADPQTGAIFRSEQWIGRTLPPLIVEVLSPPSAN